MTKTKITPLYERLSRDDTTARREQFHQQPRRDLSRIFSPKHTKFISLDSQRYRLRYSEDSTHKVLSSLHLKKTPELPYPHLVHSPTGSFL